MNRKAFIFIILGAIFWGTISWYVKHLYALGFTAMEVVLIRALTSSIILIIMMLFFSRNELKLHKWTDLKYFIGTGVISIIFFNYSLFKAIELSTIPIASALLYTAPAFVIVLSIFLFQEQLTKHKLIALFITLIGIFFVVGLSPFEMSSITPIGILFGLGAGFGYALYSIFSKFALQKYSSLTITTYTFLIASLTLLPFFPSEKLPLLLQREVIFYGFGLGLLPTAVAYMIYTIGLQYTEASKASILTTVEPVVATLIGIFVFREPFSFMQMIGMICILGAVILIHRSTFRSTA
ncbi:MAG TPA: EamA family transporter [Cerasibacillus sp.]|uniref:EamA family transporter n=1 Tax=Cerasibacillus sp. TaxID=2498711 RepID=UPI002F40E689